MIQLGNYFRSNLQQEVEEVDLSKEIEHINSYVEIEKARFGDKLKIVYDIPVDLKCQLPPLLLQPLVENAIKHGVLGRIEGGQVEIIGSKEDVGTKLIVRDNGVGIGKEALDTLFSKDETRESIGLINVNERLKNKYGEEYGLKIESQVNLGTTATIIIPKN